MAKSTKFSFSRDPFLWLALIVIMINCIVLDILIIKKLFMMPSVLGTTATNTCPQACVNLINKTNPTSSTAKEYFVPLGSGSNGTTDWTTVSGATATIDGTSYGKIKKAVFEATIYVPAGSQRVWVRLLNATDGTVVRGSEVSTESNGPILLISDALSLNPGSRTYQVQIKSQLGATTHLTQSRIHITTY